MIATADRKASATAPFPGPIRAYLADFAARTRRVRLARAVLVAVAVVLGWTMGVAVFDRLVGFGRGVMLTFLLAEAALVVALLARPVREIFRRGVDWVGLSAEVERREPAFGQRLVTVTSQLLAPPGYRCSPQMLDALVGEVSAAVATSSGGRLVGLRPLAGPAAVVLAFGVLASGLSFNQWLNFPQLVFRQMSPLGDVPPVTTTLLTVTPPGDDVREHESLAIRASVRHLGRGPAPQIHLSTDGRAWDHVPMMPAGGGGGGAYTHALTPGERDVQYYVTAGDARSRTFTARVLRRPVVAEFRIRYAYPAYTGRGALSVHNTDGLIEAPRGTEATVTVVATEPLTSAALRVDGKHVDMTVAPGGERNVWQARLAVVKDQSCELDMVSDRGVVGRGPQTMQVRSVPDRPPLVRILQPATDLRLGPRDTVPVSFQALDDYGVSHLVVQAQVNANPPIDYVVKLKGDPRRIDDLFEFDLAPLNLGVGDVVSVTVRATDRASQGGGSDLRHILVSPRSIDVTTHQRLAELSMAAEYARDWAARAQGAKEAVEGARRDGGGRSGPVAATGRSIAAAREAGGLLRQSLLRSVVYSASARMSDAVAAWVDAVTEQMDAGDRVAEALVVRERADDAMAERIARAAAGAAALAGQVKQLADGEQAAAVLADRANVSAPPTTAPTNDPAAGKRRQQTLDRARQDIAAALAAMGLKAADPNVDAALQKRVEAARRLVAGAKGADLVAASRRWAEAMRRDEPQPPRLDERLTAATQAEALRPDADVLAARDLQLAARAAAALAEPADEFDDPARAKARAAAWDAYPDALAALRAEHAVNRRALQAATPADARHVHAVEKAAHAAASKARGRMVAWANPHGTPDEIAAKVREAEELAMAASAYTAERDFDRAEEADRRLAAAVGRPEVADATRVPRAIDRISRDQEQVAAATDRAADERAGAVAGAQQDVAEEIARTGADPGAEAVMAPFSAGGDPVSDSRGRATEAITAAQEKLASLPMQLSDAQQSGEALAETLARHAAAQADALAATPAARESADRAVQMTRVEVQDARKAFATATAPLSDRTVQELIDSLRPYAPETTGAVLAIEDQLRGALADLRQALVRGGEGGGQEGVEPIAQSVRDAIRASQDALRDAQQQLVERDPLVSAKWFARAAADALGSSPPNKRSASANQKRTLDALNKAAVDALRRSKNTRLSSLPGYAPFYLPPVPAWGDGEVGGAGERLLQALPGVREWGRLRDRLGDGVVAPVRETDPPGFSDALRIYFEVLGREDGRGREKKP